jgi:hypothetical protein
MAAVSTPAEDRGPAVTHKRTQRDCSLDGIVEKSKAED